MATAFAGDRTNFRAGSMRVTFNSIDLGYTEGGIEVTLEESRYERKGDQDGDSILDEISKGGNVKVSMNLKEIIAARFDAAFPGATVVSNLVSWGGALPGTSRLAGAATLTLHPLDLDDSDTSKDLNFFKAVPEGKSTMRFGPDADVTLPVTFKVYGDTAKTRGLRYFTFGS